MRHMFRVAVLVVLAATMGCMPTALREMRASPRLQQAAPLLLISIDGFRPDYLDRALTPTLARLANDGARAVSMQPSFPSLTFPNHYTLVTGLTPDHHGIVDNTMEDPAIPGERLSLSNRKAVADRRWWDQAIPIWVSANRAGLRTATMFWPGSEVLIRGAQPDYWKAFDATVTAAQRVDQVLSWLDLPADARPRFLTLYFDDIDHQAHKNGPDSAEVNSALAQVDRALARLVVGLRQRGLDRRINMVIVSDHGMAATPPQQMIDLDALVDTGDVDVVMLGAIAGLRSKSGHEQEVRTAIRKTQPHVTCWPKDRIPARLRYGLNPRVPEFVCLADVGWKIVPHGRFARNSGTAVRGAHGYDNAAPDMRALFIANGPAFVPGTVLGEFPNVDVYPLLAYLLRIQSERNDGDLPPLQPALREYVR